MTLAVPEDLRGSFSILSDLAGLSDADPRDLTESQITSMRGLFEDKTVGLFLFATQIFGYKDMTLNIHLPIARFLSKWGQSTLTDGSTITVPPTGVNADVADSDRRLMVCIPREMFKTSMNRALMLWTLACDPGHNPTIGLYNEKAENSQSWVGAIAEVVERSRLFQILWRDMIPKGIGYWDTEVGITRSRGLKWGNGGLKFERTSYGIPELSIEPHGIGGASVGKHFTHMIFDDIIGKEAAYSQAVMQNAIDWVDNSRPLERPAENGNLVVFHTPWAYADVYAHMLKKWPNDFKVHKRHLLEDGEGEPDHLNGTSIFPEKISTTQAYQLLKTDFFVNMSQYQCQPRAGRSQSFDDAWFGYGLCDTTPSNPVFKIDRDSYDPDICDPESGDRQAPYLIPLSWMSKAVILDPAPSKPSDIKRFPHANNGIVVVGIDPWSRRFALDCAVSKECPTEVLDLLMELCLKWRTRTIGIEEVNFSALYAPLFQRIIRHEYSWEPTFVPCMTKGREKYERIKQLLIPPFQNHYWYLNKLTCMPLINELAEFPNGETIDIVDALSYTDEVVQRPDTVEQQELWLEQQSNSNRGLSGYGEMMVGETVRG